LEIISDNHRQRVLQTGRGRQKSDIWRELIVCYFFVSSHKSTHLTKKSIITSRILLFAFISPSVIENSLPVDFSNKMADTKNKQLFHDIAKQLAKRHGEEQCPADVVRQISESVHLFQLAGSWPVVAADSKAPAWKRPLAYIIVRHGATEWSANGRHTSRTDLPLTTEGECEALIDGALLNGALLDVSKAPVQCFYSSLQRAKQTGQLAAPQYAAEAVVTDLLREWFYGDYEGLLTSV
jgi:hypothetical protein